MSSFQLTANPGIITVAVLSSCLPEEGDLQTYMSLPHVIIMLMTHMHVWAVQTPFRPVSLAGYQ